MTQLSTSRLLLREWRDSDLAPFAQLNADPEVMRYFPSVLDRAQSDEFAVRAQATFARQGWGLWAAEVPGIAAFIGFVGLNQVGFEAHFTPAIEVGWRLDRQFWGRGYATKGARTALEFAFTRLHCEQIVSFTTAGNERSRRVMQRLGMTHNPSEDFDHPAVLEGPLRRHVLYRISNENWRRTIARASPSPERLARTRRGRYLIHGGFLAGIDRTVE
ncbi:MAG: GNAT family N-acetyltransferase [Solirubrobacteraceae bacterium]